MAPDSRSAAARDLHKPQREATHLKPEEKLEALRAGDPFREWSSLDDKRFCLLCERTFTGRQVEITRVRGRRVILRCPGDNCRSSPNEWVFPGNPLISDKCWRDWQRAFEG